jgi:hypothetical protein
MGRCQVNTHVKMYEQELLHYKLFEFKWDLIFTINHFIFKVN